MLKPSTNIESITPLSPANTQKATKPLELSSLLEEFAQWRASKNNPADPIPDALWEKVFQLEKTYPCAALKQLLNISTKQYKHKVAQLNVNNTRPDTPKGSPQKLCQVTVKKEPYQHDALPSGKTLIVEFCREDGKIMKIHTTQDSIPTLMKTFFGGEQ